jgi:polyferredoxin
MALSLCHRMILLMMKLRSVRILYPEAVARIGNTQTIQLINMMTRPQLYCCTTDSGAWRRSRVTRHSRLR